MVTIAEQPQLSSCFGAQHAVDFELLPKLNLSTRIESSFTIGLEAVTKTQRNPEIDDFLISCGGGRRWNPFRRKKKVDPTEEAKNGKEKKDGEKADDSEKNQEGDSGKDDKGEDKSGKDDDQDDEGDKDKPEKKKDGEEEEEEEEESSEEESSEEEESDDDEKEKEEEEPEGYKIVDDPSFADLETESLFEDEEEEEFDPIEAPREKFYDVLDKNIKVKKISSYLERKFAERKVHPPFPEGGWTWRQAKLINDAFEFESKKPKPVEGKTQPNRPVAAKPLLWKLEFIDEAGGEIILNVEKNPDCIAPFESETKKEKFHKWEEGVKVDVLDEFISPHTRKKMRKWRSGKVVKANEYWLRIHFTGWSRIWDEWVHVLMKPGKVLEHTRKTQQYERRMKRQMANFQKVLNRKRGLQIVEIDGDGNCLFRSVAHQIYGSPSAHRKVREECCSFMMKNQSRFKVFVPNIALHIRKMKRDGEWGDDTEIRAMEELYDRPFELYMVDTWGLVYKPTKIHFDGDLPKSMKKVEPLRVSYHGKCHYNSVVPSDLKMTKTMAFKPPPKRTTKKIKNHRDKMMRKAEKAELRRVREAKKKEELEKRKKEMDEENGEEDEDNAEEKKPEEGEELDEESVNATSKKDLKLPEVEKDQKKKNETSEPEEEKEKEIESKPDEPKSEESEEPASDEKEVEEELKKKSIRSDSKEANEANTKASDEKSSEEGPPPNAQPKEKVVEDRGKALEVSL